MGTRCLGREVAHLIVVKCTVGRILTAVLKWVADPQVHECLVPMDMNVFLRRVFPGIISVSHMGSETP